MVQTISDLARTKIIKNGEKTKRTFSDQEMERRNKRLRRHMAENDIDAVIFTSYHNIKYYSDYLYTAFGRNYGLIVTQNKHITVSANIDGGMPWRSSYQDNIVYTDWKRDNFYYAIKEALKKDGITGGKFGIEFDEVSIELKAEFKKLFPNSDFVDISKPTMRFRMIKSPEEIQVIKDDVKIADIGGEAVVEAIEAGVPEYEVALAGTQAMTRKIAELYPHTKIRDTWVWFQSGINTDGAHNWPTTRKLEKGDILSLNTFPMLSGYYTALERTLFLDHVDDKSLEYWKVNLEVYEKGLELIKPGVKCKDVCKKLNDIYREHNLLENRTFGYGHSFGVLCHYYGREEGLEFREDIETELKPGMVVSMEPMIMIPEGEAGAGGYREHDILVINEDGSVENITGFPVGPENNIIKA